MKDEHNVSQTRTVSGHRFTGAGGAGRKLPVMGTVSGVRRLHTTHCQISYAIHLKSQQNG